MKAVIFLCLAFFATANAEPADGTIAMFRDGSSGAYSAGIPQVYYNGAWTGICKDLSFEDDEADVICRQLGYNGANSYSTAGEENYGTVNTATITQVNCFTSFYQVLFQCDVTTSSSCDSVDNAVTVSCKSERTWDSPYSGQVRLASGDYTSDGIVETYCNDAWGQVCSSEFDDNAAEVVCEQLGYSSYTSGSRSQNTSRPIWLDNPSCSSISVCLSTCQSCPGSDAGTITCTGDNVAYVECSSFPTSSNVNIASTCNLSAVIAALVGIIVGVIVACCCLTILCTVIPLAICCCLGVGIGASMKK